MDMILKQLTSAKFNGADGGKQRVAEHPAQFGLWPAGAERGW